MSANAGDLQYEIVEKPAFAILGKGLCVSTKEGRQFQQIPEFWVTCNSDGSVNQLVELAAGSILPARTVLGVCTDFIPLAQQYTYLVAVEKPGGPITGAFVEKPIPASTWAIFESVGPLPDAIQEVWKNIWPSFFNESSEYVHADGPDLEVYFPGDTQSPDYRCQVWIPVTKKVQ